MSGGQPGSHGADCGRSLESALRTFLGTGQAELSSVGAWPRRSSLRRDEQASMHATPAQAWDGGQVTPILPKRQPRAIPAACLLTKHDGKAWGLMTVSAVDGCGMRAPVFRRPLRSRRPLCSSLRSRLLPLRRSRAEPALCPSDRAGFLRTGERPLLPLGRGRRTPAQMRSSGGDAEGGSRAGGFPHLYVLKFVKDPGYLQAP